MPHRRRLYQGLAKYLHEANGFAHETSAHWQLLSEAKNGLRSMLEREYNAWMKGGRGRLEFTAKCYMGDPIYRISFRLLKYSILIRFRYRFIAVLG